MPSGKTVYIVDEELSGRNELRRFLSEAGCEVVSFASADEFLSCARVDGPSCVLLGVLMPDGNGFEVQERMRRSEIEIPVIFITGQGDIAMAVKAIKAGAIDFLTKPVSKEALIDAIASAHARSAEGLEARTIQSLARERISRLTAREREVLELVLAGKPNKQIASVLSSQESTVKVHRSRLMRKLETGSLAELLRFGQQLNRPRDPEFDRRDLPRSDFNAARTPSPRAR